MKEAIRKWLETLPAGTGPSTQHLALDEFLVGIIDALEAGKLNKDMPVGIGGMGVTGWVTGEVILCKVEPDQVPDSDKETYPEGVFVVDTNRKPSCILSEEATFTDLD